MIVGIIFDLLALAALLLWVKPNAIAGTANKKESSKNERLSFEDYHEIFRRLALIEKIDWMEKSGIDVPDEIKKKVGICTKTQE